VIATASGQVIPFAIDGPSAQLLKTLDFVGGHRNCLALVRFDVPVLPVLASCVAVSEEGARLEPTG
jgi:hypothetical protein